MRARFPAACARAGLVCAGALSTVGLAGCGPPAADEVGQALVGIRSEDVAVRMSDAVQAGLAADESETQLLARARNALDDDSRAYVATLTGSGLVVRAAFYEEFDTGGLEDPESEQVVRCVEFTAPGDDLTDVEPEDVPCPPGATRPAWVRGG